MRNFLILFLLVIFTTTSSCWSSKPITNNKIKKTQDSIPIYDNNDYIDTNYIYNIPIDTISNISTNYPQSQQHNDKNTTVDKKSDTITHKLITNDTNTTPQKIDYLNNKPILNIGDITYNIDDTMYVNETSTIYLTITKNINIDKIIDKIPSFNTNNTKTEKIRIHKIMKVTLIDPLKNIFIIVPITNKTQIIENKEITFWEWDVTPMTKGNYKLKLTVAIITNETGEIGKTIEVYNGFIKVYSHQSLFNKISNFLKIYWTWIISSILLPFVFFLYKNKKKKEK